MTPVERLEWVFVTLIALSLKGWRRAIFGALGSQEDACFVFREFMELIE